MARTANLSGLLDLAMNSSHELVRTVCAIEEARTAHDGKAIRAANRHRLDVVEDLGIALTGMRALGHEQLAMQILQGTLGNCDVARSLARNRSKFPPKPSSGADNVQDG